MITFVRSAVIAVAITMAQPGAGTAQPSAATNDTIPSFRVEVLVAATTDFVVRLDAYSELRRRLESQLPAVTVTDDVRQLRRARRSLAQAIRSARPGAVQGEFFTPAISAQVRLALAPLMDDAMCAVIMDDNPGGFTHAIDGAYPDGKAFATMPGILLARLPELPADIQFRFIGRHLILYDVRANTIVDRMPDAIRCTRDN